MNRTDYLNSIIPAEHAEYCFIEWHGRGGWCLHFHEARYFGDGGIDFLGRDWKAAEKQLRWIYGIKEKKVPPYESGTKESQAATRRVMARLCPGAVEIVPGSWSHRITRPQPTQKHAPQAALMRANSSAERKQHQPHTDSAKKRTVDKIGAGESQQQMSLFSEVENAYEKAAQGN